MPISNPNGFTNFTAGSPSQAAKDLGIKGGLTKALQDEEEKRKLLLQQAAGG